MLNFISDNFIAIITLVFSTGALAFFSAPYTQTQQILKNERERMSEMITGFNKERDSMRAVIREVSSARDEIANSYRGLIIDLSKQQNVILTGLGMMKIHLQNGDVDKALRIIDNLENVVGSVDLKQMLMIESLLEGVAEDDIVKASEILQS